MDSYHMSVESFSPTKKYHEVALDNDKPFLPPERKNNVRRKKPRAKLLLSTGIMTKTNRPTDWGNSSYNAGLFSTSPLFESDNEMDMSRCTDGVEQINTSERRTSLVVPSDQIIMTKRSPLFSAPRKKTMFHQGQQKRINSTYNDDDKDKISKATSSYSSHDSSSPKPHSQNRSSRRNHKERSSPLKRSVSGLPSCFTYEGNSNKSDTDLNKNIETADDQEESFSDQHNSSSENNSASDDSSVSSNSSISSSDTSEDEVERKGKYNRQSIVRQENTDEQPHYNHVPSLDELFFKKEDTVGNRDRSNSIHKKRREFLISAVPKKIGVVQCNIQRLKKSKQQQSTVYNVYLQYQGKEESKCQKQQLIMTSRKFNKKGAASYYFISMTNNCDEKDKQNFMESYSDNHLLGKLKSNFVGTEFLIYDSGCSPKDIVPIPPACFETKNSSLRKELGVILYAKNILGSRGPRKMQVCLPKVIDKNLQDDQIQHHDMVYGSSNKMGMLETFKEQLDQHSNLSHKSTSKRNSYHLYSLGNKSPRWSDQVGAYVLNFNGRVTKASVKNFQLVHTEQCSSINEKSSKRGGGGQSKEGSSQKVDETNDILLQVSFGVKTNHALIIFRIYILIILFLCN